jgi:hypothetical protein
MSSFHDKGQSSLAVTLLCLLSFPHASVAADDAKAQPPTGATRQAALKAVRDGDRDEIANARKRGGDGEFARRLARVGTEERKDVDARWALLTVSIELAIEGRNLVDAAIRSTNSTWTFPVPDWTASCNVAAVHGYAVPRSSVPECLGVIDF